MRIFSTYSRHRIEYVSRFALFDIQCRMWPEALYIQGAHYAKNEEEACYTPGSTHAQTPPEGPDGAQGRTVEMGVLHPAEHQRGERIHRDVPETIRRYRGVRSKIRTPWIRRQTIGVRGEKIRHG